MRYTFRSCFSDKMAEYVQLKKTLRYNPKTTRSYLCQIDKAAVDLNINSHGITKPLADAITKRRPHETARSRYARISTLYDFSSYLVDADIPSFLPIKPKYPTETEFTPYIYSDEQISALLETCDKMRVQRRNRSRSPIFFFPLLIRVLIGTGLRIGEAIKLKVTDIDLEKNKLRVRMPKNREDREVPFSGSLNTVIRNHLEFRNVLCLPKRQSDFLFSTVDGIKPDEKCLQYHWKQILIDSGIPFSGRSKSPRVHDIRHTCATKSYFKLIELGYDDDAALAIVAAYLGHKSVNSTERDYLQLLETHADVLMKDVDIFTSRIYPKV